MALLNKVWRESEFVPSGAEPGLTKGFPWRDAVESRTVAQIARQRFGYPDASNPGLQTYVNLPDRSLGVRDTTGSMVYPDIVVVDSRTTEVRILAEVETVRSLEDAADLMEKWKAFSRLGPLYLFIPMSRLDEARSRLKTAGVRPAALRAWRYMAGMDFTDIVELPS
ncbi:MAG: hypothetical protein ACHRXM_40525 [Isosphaerales bacterium]